MLLSLRAAAAAAALLLLLRAHLLFDLLLLTASQLLKPARKLVLLLALALLLLALYGLVLILHLIELKLEQIGQLLLSCWPALPLAASPRAICISRNIGLRAKQLLQRALFGRQAPLSSLRASAPLSPAVISFAA